MRSPNRLSQPGEGADSEHAVHQKGYVHVIQEQSQTALILPPNNNLCVIKYMQCEVNSLGVEDSIILNIKAAYIITTVIVYRSNMAACFSASDSIFGHMSERISKALRFSFVPGSHECTNK